MVPVTAPGAALGLTRRPIHTPRHPLRMCHTLAHTPGHTLANTLMSTPVQGLQQQRLYEPEGQS